MPFSLFVIPSLESFVISFYPYEVLNPTTFQFTCSQEEANLFFPKDVYKRIEVSDAVNLVLIPEEDADLMENSEEWKMIHGYELSKMFVFGSPDAPNHGIKNVETQLLFNTVFDLHDQKMFSWH
ncbi:hypothetical protein GEMRC1_012978 [Eukaryota sp. GEM-RC1]